LDVCHGSDEEEDGASVRFGEQGALTVGKKGPFHTIISRRKSPPRVVWGGNLGPSKSLAGRPKEVVAMSGKIAHGTKEVKVLCV